MSHRPSYYVIFGLIGLAAAVALFLLLQATTEWNWFPNWLIAASVATFILYGYDKLVSKTNSIRVPEAVLHLMALAGGFVGALLGMLVFRHKSNFRAHPLFLPIIIVSAVLYGFLAYRLFWAS